MEYFFRGKTCSSIRVHLNGEGGDWRGFHRTTTTNMVEVAVYFFSRTMLFLK